MSKLKLFSLSVLATVCVLLAVIYAHRPQRRLIPTDLKQVTSTLYVTSQLKPENVAYLLRRGVRTVVDIRPDGEESGQATSAEILRATEDTNIRFHYIPVPHGPIPADAVSRLNDVLDTAAGSTVLYCRTGNRAVRTFALVEASHPDGLDAETILAQVRQAGFSADDLRDDINRRIADRHHPSPDHP